MQEEDSPSVIPSVAGISRQTLALVVVVSVVAGFFGGYIGGIRGGSAPLSDGGNQTIVVQENSAVIDVVKNASPAVVSIVVSKDVSALQRSYTSPFGFDPFSQFFGFGSGSGDTQPNVQEVGAGSGFIISEDGLILTNKHVVSDMSAKYTVVLNDSRSFEATVLTRDPVNDLAIVKISATGLPTLELADSDMLQIGQRVIAIGNSLGQYANTVTTGVVSGIGRSITAGGESGNEQLEGVIQTDAAINPGNSGGPLLDISGKVIGINTAIDREGQAVGFAIPSSDATRALTSFRKTGKITRPFLGVRYAMITQEMAKRQSLERDYGAWLTPGGSDPAVQPGSPAERGGLKANDIILEVEGKRLDETYTLAGALRGFDVGQTVQLTVYRNGSELSLRITLEEKS
ncbi:MAG: trypsin-like peptidase domain-containing protein [Candidatus Doudnabacteria bacterium]|nr:trypsin-like peptidase domain-containing protein [Candidatus Doudnabacteria bacterium]